MKFYAVGSTVQVTDRGDERFQQIGVVNYHGRDEPSIVYVEFNDDPTLVAFQFVCVKPVESQAKIIPGAAQSIPSSKSMPRRAVSSGPSPRKPAPTPSYWQGKSKPMIQRPTSPTSWLQAMQDTPPNRVRRGSARWAAGVAIICSGGVLALSTLMEWGRTTTNVLTTKLSGIGSASAQVTGTSRSDFALVGGDAVGGSALFLGLVGAVAGAGFLWTRWRTASAVIAAVAGGLAFIVSVTCAVNMPGTMKSITGPVSGDITVGFGLVSANVVAVVLAGLGVTSLMLERRSGESSEGQRP